MSTHSQDFLAPEGFCLTKTSPLNPLILTWLVDFPHKSSLSRPTEVAQRVRDHTLHDMGLDSIVRIAWSPEHC